MWNGIIRVIASEARQSHTKRIKDVIARNEVTWQSHKKKEEQNINPMGLPRFARNDTRMGLPRFARNDTMVKLLHCGRNDMRLNLSLAMTIICEHWQ